MKTCWKVNPPGSLGEGTEYYFAAKEDAVKAAIPDFDKFVQEFGLYDLKFITGMALWLGLVTPTDIPIEFFFSEEHGEVTFSEAELVAVE